MKHILKQSSPQTFEDWKKNKQPKEWTRPPNAVLLKFLLEDQGHICCYCGIRIFEDHKTIIEHLLPKDENKYPDKMYDYDNLLASCNGDQKNIIHICSKEDTWESIQQKYHTTAEDLYRVNFSEQNNHKLNPYTDQLNEGIRVIVQKASNPKKLHCDAKKSNKEISIYPKMGNCESYFFYDYDGSVKAVDDSNQDVIDTIEILGLNVEKLQKLRARVINENVVGLDEYSIQDLTLLRQHFDSKDDEGRFTPFCQVMVSLLEDEIKVRRATEKG